MRLVTGVLIVSALVLPASSWGQAVSAPTRAEAQKLLQDRDDARHKGDWTVYGQFFTADATVINSDGRSFKGRAQIQKSVEDMWGAGVYKGARMKTLVGSVDAIAANVAVVDATYEITNIPGGGTRNGLSTFVLVKSTDGWKVAAARSIVPTAAGSVRRPQ
jgi:uncharacterized protein (TIGR02246 family)